MKYLFYLLVVINLVFLVWKFGLQGRDSLFQELDEQRLEIPKDLSSQPLTPGEVDLGSPMPATQLPVEPPKAEARPEEVAKGCFELGPLVDREQAQSYLNLLRLNVKDARVVVKAGDVPDGWWVIYPKAASLEAARVNRQLLFSHGIRGTWLFDSGPLQNAISVGLYKTREEALKAEQLLVEQGIAVKATPRLVQGEVLWIRLPWTGLPLELDDIVQTLNSQDPALKMPAPVPCG